MAENKTIDPFKPVQPRIPGVSDRQDTSSQPTAEAAEEMQGPGFSDHHAIDSAISDDNLKFVWVGITLIGALATIFYLYGHGQKVAPVSAASSDEPAPAAAVAIARPSQTQAPAGNRNWPVAPGVVATASQLAKPWSAKEFYFRDQVTERETPAMVVRLPGGALWAIAMREPYGTCDLEYVTDLQKLQQDYDFPANHPMVADPCNKSVFDLTKYGNGPDGLVRGEVVKGSAFRPPLAIEVRTEKNEIIAVRTEQ